LISFFNCGLSWAGEFSANSLGFLVLFHCRWNKKAFPIMKFVSGEIAGGQREDVD
jgi:hypothetical protein